MARRRTLENKLSELSRLSGEADPSLVEKTLTAALDDKSAHVVARAAAIVGERRLDSLSARLESSMERFFDDPVASDKGCIAKTAIVRALVTLESDCVAVFLRGLGHVQMEPAFGGPVDTAADLRSQSAFGLAASSSPDVVDELVPALVDPEKPVRIAAVRALAATGRLEVPPVLRLKVLAGDPDPEVFSEALEALLALDPVRSLTLAERYLDGSDDVLAEAAALAVGGARPRGAFELLTARIDDERESRLERVILLAVAMIRDERSLDYLIARLASATRRRGESLVRALAIHRYDDRVRERVERELPDELAECYAAEFGRADPPR